MEKLNKLLQAQFNKMCAHKLFRAELSGSIIWALYISAFKDDPIFRDPASTSHNCNLCNNFIRRYGNIVAVNEYNELMTIFDVELDKDNEYYDSMLALSKEIKASKIADVFFETFDELNSLPYESCTKTNTSFKLGTDKNVKRYTKEEAELYKSSIKANDVVTFNHFSLQLPTAFVDKSGKSVESIMGDYRSAKEVFQRAMEEISIDTLLLVKDLINQGSLLNGDAHLFKIDQFIPLKREYDSLNGTASDIKRDNWCWIASYGLPIAKFRNELIGVLCSDLAQGEELNKACQAWNKRVDPANYMKATAPITKKQIAEAQTFVEENGYVESFNRRFANIDDIKVSEILHSNVGDGKIKSVSIFDGVKSTVTRHKKSEFDGVEEVSIDKFMKDILPGCTSIEAYLTNTHEGNLVTLTTSNVEESKPIFKWNNNYSWTFNGNLAGKSEIKEAVKDKGGNVTGVLRFSMIWNDADDKNDQSDLDAWCKQPTGQKIGYDQGFRKDSGNRFSNCGGQLDLDNQHPGSKIAVENIYFRDLNSMSDGVYTFWVNQFSARNSKGFKAEIEFNDEMYSYSYDKAVSGNVKVAEVTLQNGKFTIKHLLPETASGGATREIYGLETGNFHKVNLVCLSPNHWNDNNVGNKHYFFMLDKCKTPNAIRSFHIENLLPELAAHRKVLEVLGGTTMIEPVDKQLSGLGFNSTVADELIVKLQGTHKRVIKIKFK